MIYHDIKPLQVSNLRREANDKEHKFVASLLQLRHVCRFCCRCFDGPEGENGVSIAFDRQDAGSHRDAEGSGWKVFASNLDIRHHPTSSDQTDNTHR